MGKSKMLFMLWFSLVNSTKVREGCASGQYLEPSLLECLPCLSNASLVTSKDGFGCACEEHSIPVGVGRCKACNITEMVSADGAACVPRRCHTSAGRISCRKCPNDYISVTQNFDGSPMKEVQCIKCARGFKTQNNACVRCEACGCYKHEVVVKGKCVPKQYVLDRPKYAENQLHPDELLEIVKIEYLCKQGDIRACRSLSSICVRNFYTTDPAGPCRLWIQNVTNIKGLPLHSIAEAKTNKPELFVGSSQDKLNLILAVHTNTGGFKIIRDQSRKELKCLLPMDIKVGDDMSYDCSRNVSDIKADFGDTFELYLYSHSDDNIQPLPISIRKPNGYYVQKGTWPSSKFRKFFLIHSYLSTSTNITNTVYLHTLLVRVRIERISSSLGSLQLHLSIEAQYATKSYLTDVITTTLQVQHDMPSAGILRGLQICGAVSGSLLVAYAAVRWRGEVKRGGRYVALLPLLASAVADALYCATILSVVHALAAEAGSLGMTLPLSLVEEYYIQSLVYTAVCLKTVIMLWMNYKQCCCDIFLLDWTKYNPPNIEVSTSEKLSDWREEMLAREWIALQTNRRVSPGFTATVTLLALHLIEIWQPSVPRSPGYNWVIASTVWWCSYSILLCIGYLLTKFIEPAWRRLPKICVDLQLSLLVFQEEYYAHYIDGRNEDVMDFRSSTHPLQTCRIICSPQLRTVYQKLINNGDFNDYDRNRKLLTKFLGAFFERALDGLNWVGNERTMLEKLLDVELVAREGGNTSVLLYDTDATTPSCLAVTWLGEEWLLATFDSMLFGSVLIMTGNHLTAALVTLVVWKLVKFMRLMFGSWNVKNKIGMIK